jgi:transposase
MSRRKQPKSEQPQEPVAAPESGRPAESQEGARRATGGRSAGRAAAPPPPVKRWTRTRKMEVVMRMIRGESVEALSRELGVEVYRLEEWSEMALAGMEGGLRAQKKDAMGERLDAAHKAYGKAMMENELLRERCRRLGIPLPPKRSK